MAGIAQGKPELDSIKYSDYQREFWQLKSSYDSISKECANIGWFSGSLTKVCEKFKEYSGLVTELETKTIEFVKVSCSKKKDSPIRDFSISKDPKLVSLLKKKLQASTIVTERIPLYNPRFSSFYELTQLLLKRKPKIMVETGTARAGIDHCISDGCSTVLIGKIAQILGSKLYSVDISADSCIRSRNVTSFLEDSVEVIEGDSISYLKSFNVGLIDFLYLDSYDFEADNPNPSQEHHHKEIIAAYNKLHKSSIVMVDDCTLIHGGKCPLVRNYLLERGWTLYFSNYQQIFIYEK